MPDYILNRSYQNFHVLCFLLKVHFFLFAGLLDQEESTKGAEANGFLKLPILDLKVSAVGMWKPGRWHQLSSCFSWPVPGFFCAILGHSLSCNNLSSVTSFERQQLAKYRLYMWKFGMGVVFYQSFLLGIWFLFTHLSLSKVITDLQKYATPVFCPMHTEL